MRNRPQVIPTLLTMALLPWMGLLQAVPHNHADVLVPQEVLACTASGPSSHEVHLHGAGLPLAPHPCLACLAGISHAAPPSALKVAGVECAGPLGAERPHDLHSRNNRHLPLSRGPPAAV